jgi:hypothetical protein
MPRLVGAPAVASSGDGRLEVFVFSVDGALWHLSQTRVGGGLDRVVWVDPARRVLAGRVVAGHGGAER